MAASGLTVRRELDENTYPNGIVVTDAEMAEINILRDDFHGDWNYTIRPHGQTNRAVVS